MGAALTPSVVDVPLSTLNQTPPDHSGPIGRLAAMVNAEVVKYVPPQAGGAGGATPQAILVQQREAFVSLSGETRNSLDGTGPQDPLVTGELVATLGDQLLDIGDSVPKVYNGTDWTTYRDAGVRVLAGKLSESIIHTSNRTIQACDSAVIDGVTCFVWTETVEGLTTSYVGLKSAAGAWIVTPRALFTAAVNTDIALAKVVSDGTRFWVFYDNAGANLQIQAYDTHGVLLAAATKVRRWTTSPGFWDIIVTPSNAVLLAQPGSYSPGVNVHVDLTRFAIAAGPSITQASNIDTSIRCIGPVAWLTNKAGFSAFSYLATIDNGGEGSLEILAYEINESTLAKTHEYDVTNVVSSTIDSMTGYIRAGSGIGVVVAVSFLSEYGPVAGPPNDPGLRSVRVYDCERDGTQVFIKQANGVVLQSRAFQVPTSPPEAPDFYAVTYYQSGGGLLPSQQAQIITIDTGDGMTGALDQVVDVAVGDALTGAPHALDLTNAFFNLTQAVATITHNAGDSVVGATATWTLLNATFNADAPGVAGAISSSLVISGSGIANNNQSYLIIQRISATVIVTESVGSLGFAVQNDTLAGVTASLVAHVRVMVPTHGPSFITDSNPTGARPDLFPPALVNQFVGGTLAFTGMANAGNNITFTINKIRFNQPPPSLLFPSYYAENTFIILTVAGSPVSEAISPSAVGTITPVIPYAWIFANASFAGSEAGAELVVSGAGAGNVGSFTITTALTGALITSAQPTLLPEVFVEPLPSIVIHIDPGDVLTFTFNLFSFDGSYVGAFLTVTGAAHTANNGTYVITSVVSEHVVQVTPATGADGQVNELFVGEVFVTVTRTTGTSPAYQPCWFLTPLSIEQQTAGRFEYGIAYADWRFDGAELAPAPIGVDFARDHFPFALSSVPVADLVDATVVLPYRAQSFTAGQVVRSGPSIVGVASVQESTVGLKQFTLAGAAFGQAVANSGELLLPGPMAAVFTASGFHEDAVNLGFEQPFLVLQDNDPDILGLTRKAKYQLVVVAETMDENGDRTFSIPSPPLDVTLTGTNNRITIAGRTIGPTNRQLVGIAMYRTSVQGGEPTVQHYKITDDLDVNGVGFTFSSLNGGSAPDTWQFVDTQPDVAILSAEILYTDKGLTPRYPAPAFSQGVGSWCNRTWLVGYDGAIWMSGEKSEGDAVWFTPLFRYVLPTDDKPVAVAGLDEYMLVFCGRSMWYIPKTDFIAANLQSGSLPTPIELPYQNGCTGWAMTIRAGVAYDSTAGGTWLITRQLTNVWLSQDIQDDQGETATSMLVDQDQRLFVFVGTATVFVFNQVSQCWSTWTLPSAAALACAWMGRAAYQDLGTPSHVAVHTPGVFADTIGAITTPIAPDVTLAGVSMAGVRSFKRVWAIQIVGQYKGPHRLNVVVSYPDEDQDPTTYEPFTPAADDAYVYEVNPDPEEASTFGVRIFADFVGVAEPGDSFALELVSFEVGLERGVNPSRAQKRIPSNG